MAANRLYLIILCTFLKVSFLSAQTIHGTIKDSNGNVIVNANILFWNSEKKESLYGYTYSNQEGFFSYDIKAGNAVVFVEISALNFAPASQFISLGELPVKMEFALQAKEIELKEVIVQDEKAVRVKNDTVFYDPKKFLNGSEKKVEDLIKKLPGMTVDENTGEIRYKGKSIETVKLEDDDLFGNNYMLGTKNISVDMVEQVQALEKYSSNPLLRGIENSDNVAINLKLKKQKTDYSGTATLSNGYSDKVLFNDDVTLLGISKKIKSFGVLSYNNFGLDSDNLAFSFEEQLPRQLSPDEFNAKKNIYEYSSGSSLGNSRTKFNNTFFSNYNIIYKLSSKISLKNNLIYYHDKLEGFEFYRNQYFLNENETVDNTQLNRYRKKSDYYNANLQLTYNINKKSRLIADVNVKNKILNSGISVVQNEVGNFAGKVKTKDFSFKDKIEYTLRLDDYSALQYVSVFSNNDVPQELISSPGNSNITGNISGVAIQSSTFEKQLFFNKLTYLGKTSKSKQTFSIGSLLTEQPFVSGLKEDGMANNTFKNDFDYKKTMLFAEYSTFFKFNHFEVSPYLALNYYHQNLVDNLGSNDLTMNKVDISSNLMISYFLNRISSLYLKGDIKNKTQNEEYFFTNNVLIDNTSVKKNIASLDLIKSQNISLGYRYDDLFRQFLLNVGMVYSNQSNTFFNNITITPDFSTYTYFQNPANIENKSFVFRIEKHIKPLNITIKHSSMFVLSNYKNAIDDFVLRNNKSRNYNGSLFLASFFDFPVNFENALSYNIFSFESPNDFSSERTSITNSTKVLIKPFKDLLVSFNYDYYVTDTHTNNSFTFFDFDIKYKSPTLKWFSIAITGRNLLNVKTFKQVSNSDYSYSVYQSNLISRYFLMSMDVSF